MRKQTKLVAVLSAAALLAIGASMTSLATVKGWVPEGEDWVYLDRDGNRETSVWRRHLDNYYWLNEDGVMARNALVQDDNNNTYCVDENGRRVTNTWVEVDNEEDVQAGDEGVDGIPSVLYYYFGASGKAYKAKPGETNVVKEIGGKYYMFNEEGQMRYGWQTIGSDRYYLGAEKEGFAYTGWQQLEPSADQEGDGDLKWFHFGTNGKMDTGSKYIDGKYYYFGTDGNMKDAWYDSTATQPTAASGAKALASSNGLKTGWVYASDSEVEDSDSKYWYYLVNVSEGSQVTRGIPYNYQANGNQWRATVIKNKTYIFNATGKMQTGFVLIKSGGTAGTVAKITEAPGLDDKHKTSNFATDPYGSANREAELANGLYYFNTTKDSTEGQMQTGRTAITQDGETYYYYFAKGDSSNRGGFARANVILDGYLYGADGQCVMAEKGSNNMEHTAEGVIYDKDNKPVVQINQKVIVSRTGEIKKSGTVTIDGITYEIKEYVVIKETQK